MAVIDDKFCIQCGQITCHMNNDCETCAGNDADRKKEIWSKMTIEEKLELIASHIGYKELFWGL